MTAVHVLFLGVGVAALLAALLPHALHRLPISLPMVFLALGSLLFWLVPDLPDPNPLEHGEATVHLTEICVLVSLFGAGIAIDRPVGWRRWRTTWRLLAITMPLTIAVTALAGYWWLGLAAAPALLLASLLSPTDPVLATDVQVGEPTEAEDSEDEPRFALTAEAGLNDSLAFPFTLAAIAMAGAGPAPANWFGEWFLHEVLWRGGVGLLGGILAGQLLGRLFFSGRGRKEGSLAERAQGFEALACTFITYGLTELAQGYGFVAVFVCACTIRSFERAHGSHTVIHDFVEQIERLLTVAVLVLLGGAVARGLLAPLRVSDVIFALGVLLVVRPVLGRLALVGNRMGRRDRWIVSFFGVRGVGSIFYLAYALGHADFAPADRLWAVTGLVVVASVLIHGISATPVMRSTDRRRHAVADRKGQKDSTVGV